MILGLSNGVGKGILIGLGVSAVGFYLYKTNEQKVDSFLRKHGIPMPTVACTDLSKMSLEELMETKETIEDIIAERELGEDEVIVNYSGEDQASAELKAPKAKPAKA